jgi:hypothetical protein
VLLEIAGWLLLGLGLSPVFIAIGWDVWQHDIRPRLLPAADIDRLVAETIARDPHDPEGAAMHEQANHWYRCDPFEQGKWRRVRRAIRRRLQGA